MGFGKLLKKEQIRIASNLKNHDGSFRYHFMSGRNRLNYATQMQNLNEQYGAYTVDIYDKQYNDPNGQAIYYRLPLRKNLHLTKNYKESLAIDCQNSIENLTQNPNKALLKDLQKNSLRAISATKLTLSNWASMHLIRYTEVLRRFLPENLNHLYFTSGQDEVLDKGLRALRFHRHKADIAIGFSHQYFGHITAAARSLSHDEYEIKPFKYFSWPIVPHPQIVGEKQSLEILKNYINTIDKERILGIALELLGKNSSYTFSLDFLKELDNIRKETGIPLIYNETVSSFYRNGKTFFLTDDLEIKPNMLWWFVGGQLGHVLVDDQYYVEKPLTLISTWDGDEISIARNYHNILEAKNLFERSAWVFKAIEDEKWPFEKFGKGFWQGFYIKDDIKLNEIIYKAKKEKVFLSKGYNNMLLICPKLDIKKYEGEKLLEVLNKTLRA